MKDNKFLKIFINDNPLYLRREESDGFLLYEPFNSSYALIDNITALMLVDYSEGKEIKNYSHSQKIYDLLDNFNMKPIR